MILDAGQDFPDPLYISEMLVRRCKFRKQKKQQPYHAVAIDDKEIKYNNRCVTEETQEQELQIGQYIEKISLDITNIG